MPAAHAGTCLDMLTIAERATRPLHGTAQVPPCARVLVHEYECGYGLLAGVWVGAGANVDAAAGVGAGAWW